MKELCEQAVRLLSEKKSFVLATIISQDGSTPRHEGAKMLITEDSIVETIGGGGMEAMVIEEARKNVMKDHLPKIIMYDLQPKESAVSDFICGGLNEVLIAYIDADKPELKDVFAAALCAAESGKEAWFVYAIDTNEGAEYPFQICVSIKGEGMTGTFVGDDKVANDIAQAPIRLAIHGETVDGVRYVADSIHSGGTIYLFGGGHVSQQVAAYARTLEFDVVVIDDRAEYANSERFPGCKIVVLDSFDHLPDFPIDQNSYIVIITRGHMADRTCLEWAVNTDAYYIGMIGSRTKVKIVKEAVKEKFGLSQEKMDSICSPIGLRIGAETPAEIGISIVAELIQKRHDKK